MAKATRDIFVISDTHFNHANILDFKQEDGRKVRDFESVDEMNETIIDSWNEVVRDMDIVYHLGDVFFHQTQPVPIHEILSRLKGRKRLILGNHDNGKSNHLQTYFQKIMVWRMFPEFGALLTHVPVHHGTLAEKRFKGSRFNDEMINVHGHLHANNIDDARYVNVSVEQIDYTPISIEEIRD